MRCANHSTCRPHDVSIESTPYWMANEPCKPFNLQISVLCGMLVVRCGVCDPLLYSYIYIPPEYVVCRSLPCPKVDDFHLQTSPPSAPQICKTTRHITLPHMHARTHTHTSAPQLNAEMRSVCPCSGYRNNTGHTSLPSGSKCTVSPPG